MSVEVEFSKKPKDWQTITSWDTPENLEFAVDQLERSQKPYSTEKNGKQIRIWSSYRKTKAGKTPRQLSRDSMGRFQVQTKI